MAYKKLYIIGNGFDLHHKINSRYSNFQEWLQKNCAKYNANSLVSH